MKQILSLALMLFLLVGCGEKEVERASELRRIGLLERGQLISFFAPEEAITLRVRTYTLGADGAWALEDEGGISIGQEREPIERLEGEFSMTVEEDKSISFAIDCAGLAEFSVPAPPHDTVETQWTLSVSPESLPIVTGEEIAVGIVCYDSGEPKGTELDAFSNPTALMGQVLVQAVTLEFTGEEL
ncbi:MAG: hypothetical protein IKD11_03725 [Oscillospiraceae bacterium]|nr:hypothetical protein [Oscillospiraceae bacterium]